MIIESFSQEERKALEPYFTNADRPVFALINLPEVVKGALFARYSRSAKSLRRLFLDEFLEDVSIGQSESAVGLERAEALYERVFGEYGDDSVAQLGGVHLACENASNILTKVLEWGRLAAYLEQSTRYVPYTGKRDGHWRYLLPPELEGHRLCTRYREVLDHAFSVYAEWIEPMREHFRRRIPRGAGDSEFIYTATIRAKALDALRGLLPAATQSNVGIYATGQAYEALLLRMRAHPSGEVREYAAMMMEELRKVIPAFLKRVDRPDRGGAWTRYLASVRAQSEHTAERLLADTDPEVGDEVVLTDFDPEGELKVVAAALYAVSDLSDRQLLEAARSMSVSQREEVLRAYVGDRGNRRHKPGRAFERTAYRFDILSDYGAFRDLQRHRLLTLEWQRLSPRHGYVVPSAVDEVGAGDDWRSVMAECAELYDALDDAGLREIASYAVCMAYRVRYYMHMNAREAMHVIELRSAPQGHPAYRRVSQLMHREIERTAGHRAIAASMKYADHGAGEAGRLESERVGEQRRKAGCLVSS